MSRLRTCSVAAVLVLTVVVIAGCASVPRQVNSFELRSHKYPTNIYGPFKYADGTDILIGKSTFTLIVDAEMAKARSFKLRSHKHTGKVYGGFKCRPGVEVVIGRSKFTVSAVY